MKTFNINNHKIKAVDLQSAKSKLIRDLDSKIKLLNNNFNLLRKESLQILMINSICKKKLVELMGEESYKQWLSNILNPKENDDKTIESDEQGSITGEV
jgi:hypothetical protein